jgi:hypothetical protein
MDASDTLVRYLLLLVLVLFSVICRWAAFGVYRLLDSVSMSRVAPALHGELLTLACFAGAAVLSLSNHGLPQAIVLLKLIPLLAMAVFIHLVAAVVILARAVSVCDQWDQAETMVTEDLTHAIAAVQMERKRLGPLRGWWASRQFSSLQRVRHYREVRGSFLAQHALVDRYPFCRYLRLCMAKRLARLMRMHWSGWLLAILLTICRDVISWYHCDSHSSSNDSAGRVGLNLTIVFTCCAGLLAVSAVSACIVRARALERLISSLRYW